MYCAADRESGSAAEVCQPAAGRFVGHAPLTYCHHWTAKLTVAKLAINPPLPALCNHVQKSHSFLSWASWILSASFHVSAKQSTTKLSSYLHLGLPNCPFPSVHPTQDVDYRKSVLCHCRGTTKNLPLAGAEGKNKWRDISTSPVASMACTGPLYHTHRSLLSSFDMYISSMPPLHFG